MRGIDGIENDVYTMLSVLQLQSRGVRHMYNMLCRRVPCALRWHAIREAVMWMIVLVALLPAALSALCLRFSLIKT